MIIYNKEWLDNFKLQKNAKNWLSRNLISSDEYQNIIKKYLTNYSAPNIFGRIGLFIFTIIVISSVYGTFFVMFNIDDHGLLFQLIIFSILTLLATEHFFRKKYFYKSGVTDALLYSFLFNISAVIIMIIDRNSFNLNADPLIYLSVLTPIFILATLRYADAFLALLSFALLFIIHALLILKIGFIGKLILPFISMLFSYLIYYLIRKQKRKSENRYWSNCISMIEILSLSTLYLSGNYLVVRQLSEILLNAEFSPGTDISFAYIFYAYTIAVPLVYIWLGLKSKELILIRTGIILEVAGVLSIRYYYSILPPETALILAGLVLSLTAWFTIRYLKVPRNGITLEDTPESRREEMEVLSSLVISQATSNLQSPDKPTQFGGGESGGGGAGGGY